MQEFRLSFQNVIDADGIAISLAGMLIVFAALTLISLFIAALPKVLDALSDYLPAEHIHHAGHGLPSSEAPDEEELIIAALGFVLHSEMHKRQST